MGDRHAWNQDIEANQKTIAEIAREIREDIKKIFLRLPPPAPIERQSPARLTDYGRRISNSIDAKGWAKKLAPTLVGEVAGKPEYAIEAFRRSHVKKHMTSSTMVLKAMYEFGTDRDDILPVLCVVLRDELLSLRSSGDT